jgi:predicted DNA-binding transcriptional regulator YafY
MSKKVTYKDFLILQAIPQKSKTSTTDIVKSLKNQGFDLTPRTVQRDLNALSEFFAITSDNNPDTPGWSWQESANKIELPAMSPDVALGFKIMENYLQSFLPPGVFAQMGSYFQNATALLENSIFGKWQHKINTTSRRMPLIPPKINPQHLEIIYQALLENKQLKASYKPIGQNKKDYIIHPLGVVVIDEVVYLVATTWDYEDIVQFALHLFVEVEKIADNCNENNSFNLNDYITNGEFLFPIDEYQTTEVSLKINAYLAEYLNESKLAKTQKINQTDDESFELIAKMQLTEQLKWWILSLGQNIEVLKPQSLRDEIKAILNDAAQKYG